MTKLGSLLAALPPDAGLACVRDGATTIVAVAPAEVVDADGARALDWLDGMDGGWWAGFLAYDLGRAVERVPGHAADQALVPDLRFARFDARLELGPRGPQLIGWGPGRGLLERALRAAAAAPEPPDLGEWRSSLDRAAFEDRVRRILEHVRAGDCYQVNLTRRLVSDAAPDPVALYAALDDANPAPHAALLRLSDVSVVSASPERFLRVADGRISTRPIKGTGSDPEALARSAKDRAENVMIVDLSRNDLGRVCEYGSVRVSELCALERHPGLWHLASTVEGTLRPGTSFGHIARATFPPASVTGCPKPRVLELISELEPVRRGVYCGAIGWIDADAGTLDLNVAIRTFTIAGGRTYLGVGGGIVADSDPAAEWEETELKGARLLAVASGAGANAARRSAARK